MLQGLGSLQHSVNKMPGLWAAERSSVWLGPLGVTEEPGQQVSPPVVQALPHL